MASHQSLGSTSSSKKSGSFSGHPVHCYHNEVVSLRTVKYDGPTIWKRFHGCSYWSEQRTCGFFKWLDEVGDVCDLQTLIIDRDSIILELEDKIEMLKEKIRKLKAKNEKLVDEVEGMGVATTETLFEMKENNTDKKLILTLVFSWAFFTIILLMK